MSVIIVKQNKKSNVNLSIVCVELYIFCRSLYTCLRVHSLHTQETIHEYVPVCTVYM